MVAALTLAQSSYDPILGRYRSIYGGFLSKADINQILATERKRLETRLTRHTEKLLSGALDIGEWERAIAVELKTAAIQSTIFAAGGRGRTTRRHYGQAGTELKRQYGYLSKFAQAIANGELSEAQILARVKLYSNSMQISYNQSEKTTKRREGRNEASRTLDPTANHCPSCPALATDGFVPIAQVTPVGTNCQCGGNCRCIVTYRFNPRLADLIRRT
jgi:hypothetical protein